MVTALLPPFQFLPAGVAEQMTYTRAPAIRRFLLETLSGRRHIRFLECLNGNSTNLNMFALGAMLGRLKAG
jgi:hypothetical protein